MQTVWKAVENPALVDAHVLTRYLDELRSLESELQGLKKDTISLDNFEERVRKACDIKQNLFNLRVAILHLVERMKKELVPQMNGMPMMGGINLP